MDETKLTIPHQGFGYTDGTYSSIVAMGIGTGTLIHFGDCTLYQDVEYLAHAALLGIKQDTVVISYETRDMGRKGISGSFTDSSDQKHIVVIHDFRWSKAWIYDRGQGRFV